ncbi:unnamed protein product, partial [Rhizoctonia solani]
MSVPNLPIEVVSHIAGYLSKKELTSTALVCRAWVAGMLPKLYSSVSLHYCSQFEQFASTLLSAGAEGGLVQISFYVKELWIQSDDSEADKSGLAALEPCVPKLARLRELAWNLSYAPKDSKLITLFQTQCPELCAVKVSIPDVFEFKSELVKQQYATLLGFKSIVDFRLSMNYIRPDRLCDQLVRSKVALQLEVLNIRRSSFEEGIDFMPDKAFPIQSLPRLRTLEIGANEFCEALAIMKLILSAAEGLEELHITSVPEYYHHPFLKVLTNAPKLRKVTMRKFLLSLSKVMGSFMGSPDLPILGEEEEASHEEILKRKMRA